VCLCLCAYERVCKCVCVCVYMFDYVGVFLCMSVRLYLFMCVTLRFTSVWVSFVGCKGLSSRGVVLKANDDDCFYYFQK